MSAANGQIGWDEHGNLYLPREYAYIGVAMDRRDAADEMQRAFDGAHRARVGCAWPYPCDHCGTTSRVQAIEAAEDHADQTAFDAWRERGL